jgi:hypothetical protein
MKLIYESTGTPVEIGDVITVSGDECTVVEIEQPDTPCASGRVNCRIKGASYEVSWFPSVIGAMWKYQI